jgi:hypothetical protein
MIDEPEAITADSDLVFHYSCDVLIVGLGTSGA